MERITSINEIADFVRAEGIKARNDAGNIPGLYLILSMPWHGEITKILREKRSHGNHAGHIETDIGRDYEIMKRLLSLHPEKTSQEIKNYFCNCMPGYSGNILDMLYDLACYKKAQVKGKEKFKKILTYIHTSEMRESIRVVVMHDMIHMVYQFFEEADSQLGPEIERGVFAERWSRMYGGDMLLAGAADTIFELYSDYQFLQKEKIRTFLREIYEEFCEQNKVRIITVYGEK